jgi:hypothetical protein
MPFTKGDPRINRKGRPKAFDEFRALAIQIGSEPATKPDGTPILWNGKPITWAEYALRTWLTDKRLLEKFVEAAFGKVPLPIQHSGEDGGPIVHEVIFTDGTGNGGQSRESDNSAPSGSDQSA